MARRLNRWRLIFTLCFGFLTAFGWAEAAQASSLKIVVDREDESGWSAHVEGSCPEGWDLKTDDLTGSWDDEKDGDKTIKAWCERVNPTTGQREKCNEVTKTVRKPGVDKPTRDPARPTRTPCPSCPTDTPEEPTPEQPTNPPPTPEQPTNPPPTPEQPTNPPPTPEQPTNPPPTPEQDTPVSTPEEPTPEQPTNPPPTPEQPTNPPPTPEQPTNPPPTPEQPTNPPPTDQPQRPTEPPAPSEDDQPKPATATPNRPGTAGNATIAPAMIVTVPNPTASQGYGLMLFGLIGLLFTWIKPIYRRVNAR